MYSIIINFSNLIYFSFSCFFNNFSYGGIIPPVARDYHRKYIEKVVNDAVSTSGVTFADIDAIATTVKPGTNENLID